MGTGWHGSTRRRRLPHNWKRLREGILARDGYQCTRLDDGVRCSQIASEVDHIDRRAGDSPGNLASLCAWHHGQKTAAEGNNARTRQRRASEAHPGLRG